MRNKTDVEMTMWDVYDYYTISFINQGQIHTFLVSDAIVCLNSGRVTFYRVSGPIRSINTILECFRKNEFVDLEITCEEKKGEKDRVVHLWDCLFLCYSSCFEANGAGVIEMMEIRYDGSSTGRSQQEVLTMWDIYDQE